MRNTFLSLLLAVSCGGAGAGVNPPPLIITTEHSPPSSMLGPDGVTGRETDKVREMMARTGTAVDMKQTLAK